MCNDSCHSIFQGNDARSTGYCDREILWQMKIDYKLREIWYILDIKGRLSYNHYNKI